LQIYYLIKKELLPKTLLQDKFAIMEFMLKSLQEVIDISSNPGKNTNLEDVLPMLDGWKSAKFGMSTEDIVAAGLPLARTYSDSEHSMDENAGYGYIIREFSSYDIHFDILFKFINDRLCKILIRPSHGEAVTRRLFDKIFNDTKIKYGSRFKTTNTKHVLFKKTSYETEFLWNFSNAELTLTRSNNQSYDSSGIYFREIYEGRCVE